MTGFVKFGRRHLSQPARFSRDIRLRSRDGGERWFHVEASPRKLGESFEGYVGCAVDVTEAHAIGAALERRVEERTAALTEQIAERERVEATLAQMQRLEAIGQLTSGVAHDFNNLLTVVLGNVAMIERTIEHAGVDEKTIRRVAHVRTAAERGAKLTAQLLAFSRRQRLEARVVSLNDVVNGMQDLLQSTLGGGIAIRTVPAPELWPALVDPTQIELIILNLAINARDAMDVGGTLTVATRNVVRGEPERSEEPAAGEYVAVIVSDTGSGMTAEILAKAFEPFFTTKEIGKGSGLGLAQVYGFAKQSGGGVRIDSVAGEGTTVSVFLPRATPSSDAVPALAMQEAASGSIDGRLVLVLDDDDAVRSVTADELREAGCEIIEAADGATALAVLDSGRQVEAVVADFAMPGMNGVDFAREALQRRPDLPIVFVTGYADLAALAHVAEENVVQKPFAPGVVADRLRVLLNPPSA
jgi:signal transduction histidine kinase